MDSVTAADVAQLLLSCFDVDVLRKAKGQRAKNSSRVTTHSEFADEPHGFLSVCMANGGHSRDGKADNKHFLEPCAQMA
jgi:hypothetical protein